MPERLPTFTTPSGIVVVRLEQPGKPVVVLDLALIQRLEATLTQVPRSAAGLILASASDRVFVAGADLKAIQELSDDQLHRYLAYSGGVFGMIAAFPFPTAAAINGAALGGGLEIAMHCDALIAAPPPSRDGQPGKPYPIGLPEAGLSICPGWGGTNLLPARIDPADAIMRTALGKPMLFDEAKAAGMFDAVADAPESLIDAAADWIEKNRARRFERDGAPSRWIGRAGFGAKTLAALDRLRMELPDTEPVRAVLDAVDIGLTRGWTKAIETEQRHLVRLRNAPAGRAAIQAFFEKAKK